MNKVLEKQRIQNDNYNVPQNYNANELQYGQNFQDKLLTEQQFYAQNFSAPQFNGYVGQNANYVQQNGCNTQNLYDAQGYNQQNATLQNGGYISQGYNQQNINLQNGGYATQGYNQQNIAIQNASPNYQLGYTQNDQQQLYTPQNYHMNSASNQGYGVEYKAQVGKKVKTNIRAKLLIVTYFLIVTVIATLLLVNVFGINNSASANELPKQNPPIEVSQTAYDINGNALQLEEIAPIINFEYEQQTNWFDKMCDNITKIFG